MDSHTAQVPYKAKDYKSDYKPVWCPGCGDFAVLSSITKALAELALPPEEVAVISGIGCSSRIPAYTNTYGLHGLHGRVLPTAIGLKVARPELTVIAAGGDGDGFSIGGNHFLHACRRNADLTYIVMDNAVYGMTKGQASPTTEADWPESKLTPGGPGIVPFNPLQMALSSGANFIARGTTGNPNLAAQLIIEGIQHPGFSLIHILSPCITYRPEQREWKKSVRWGALEATGDPMEAQRRLMEDDGLNAGVLFKGERPVYRPQMSETHSVRELEAQFAL